MEVPRTRVFLGWLGAFALWTAIAGVFATQLYFAGLSWQQALAWTLPRWYAWGIIAPAVFWLDRRLEPVASAATRVALHFPLAIMWTSATVALRWMSRELRGTAPADFRGFYLDRLYSDLPIYAVIAGVSFARLYAAEARQRAHEARELAMQRTELERRLVESQLQSLRAQLHPHFLFNALNTISAMTETDPPRARRLMAQLGDLLRASLRHTAQPLVALADELTFLDDFLAIECARFEGRLHVAVHANEDLLAASVPSFLLQPLVENAIRHGVAPRLSGGRIDVAATADPRTLTLRVRDDGVGLPAGWTFERHAGVGLRNITARLGHLYGDRAGLAVTPIDGGGVEVRIDLPRDVAR